MYCFKFILSWKVFISSSILYDNFVRQSIIGLKFLFSFSVWNTPLHALLTFKVSVEKSTVIWMEFPLHVFSHIAFNVLSYFSKLICFNYNMPWSGSILVMSVWCPRDFLYLDGHHFLNIWELFCYYFVDYIF
jgi:hypothetical protein